MATLSQKKSQVIFTRIPVAALIMVVHSCFPVSLRNSMVVNSCHPVPIIPWSFLPLLKQLHKLRDSTYLAARLLHAAIRDMEQDQRSRLPRVDRGRGSSDVHAEEPAPL